jgi:hypothetical protein
LEQQRKGAVASLDKKVNSLLDSVDKLTRPTLEGEDAPAVLANTLREIIQSLNSVHFALEAHDKLIDMIIQDLIGTVEQVQGSAQGLLHTSMMSQVMLTTLMDKGLITEEELKATHTKVAALAKESMAKLRQ